MQADWIRKLISAEILVEGTKDDKQYIHLKTPCKIILSENVIKQLQDNYDSQYEKGGIFVAVPEKIDNETHLIIDKVNFLTNVSDEPHRSYIPNSSELEQTLNLILDSESLPIRFHTHPTHSNDILKEAFNYILQSNTSQQDQLVSEYPFPVEEFNLLMPRGLVLCNKNIANRMFVGFYNGLIAPHGFDLQRKESTEEFIKSALKVFNKLAINNQVLLISAITVSVLAIIKYNKQLIPLVLLLFAIIPLFINDQKSNPQYFAQINSGKTIISIP